TLIAAMTNPVQVVTPAPRRLVVNQNAALPAAQEPEPDLFNQESDPAEAEVAQQLQQTEASSNGATRRPRGEGPKKDRNAGLSIVKTLDLRPSGKQSLKQFVAEN